MGWDNVFHCEWNDFGKKILNYYWPKAISYDDITKTNFTIHRGAIDILSGGWPCQDNSRGMQVGAGQQGLNGKRSGLFWEFVRCIREIRPKYIVAENVPDVLTVNGGRDFNIILSELAQMGYNVSWGMLRASDIGAPHNRERLYLVAYASGVRLQTLRVIWQNAREKVERRTLSGMFNGASLSVGNPWWETKSNILRMDDAVPNRMDRFKSLGNAVVPYIPFEIFKAIEQYEKSLI